MAERTYIVTVRTVAYRYITTRFCAICEADAVIMAISKYGMSVRVIRIVMEG